ncbi:hypothetical protein So717_17800 [Roseobacter cerasinus]|uniref:3-hydroxyisobutyrate dehydrogenase-like NAD-binding domain-containing protein n=1 Tax=Roseobacter cerasinus TaxID=2602289 RepID=A0A640VQI9_9RHOB|nr:NAD-binding protein [Roseobacter cerasinus]GFE50027.1 hypothetical protein So717_17800 [Roseobacter cerasinus]
MKDFDETKPIMTTLGSNDSYMGPSGAGQVTKAVNQVLAGIAFKAIAEATQLALSQCVDAQKTPAALSGERADSVLMQEFMGKMARRDFSPTGRLGNMLKDLNGAMELACTNGLTMPCLKTATSVLESLTARGPGAEDKAALMRQFES